MRYEMKMPDLATTDSEIRIVRWRIEPGQTIERGQPLMEVETDKASMEVESVVTGQLSEVRAEVNDAVSVGQVIAVLEVEGVAEMTTAETVAPTTAAAAVATPVSDAPSSKAPTADVRPRGMFARNRAAAGTPSSATATALAPAKQDAMKLSRAQRVAAKRLLESKQSIPHFYLQTSVNVARMAAYRQARAEKKLAWDAFYVLAVARALAKFDRFRCRLEGERLVPIVSNAVGVAADIDDDLIVVPIASPTTKTVEKISDEIRSAVAKLRAGDPELRRVSPALMTISNLGSRNIENFIPIINPPEPAILGIGRVQPMPVGRDDGSLVFEPRCQISLCVDHRMAGGLYAAKFLEAIVQELESFVAPQ